MQRVVASAASGDRQSVGVYLIGSSLSFVFIQRPRGYRRVA